MLAKFSLWLAEITDRWARHLNDHPAFDFGDNLDAYEVDCGTLVHHTLIQPISICDRQRRRNAMRRHPAGSAL